MSSSIDKLKTYNKPIVRIDTNNECHVVIPQVKSAVLDGLRYAPIVRIRVINKCPVSHISQVSKWGVYRNSMRHDYDQ